MNPITPLRFVITGSSTGIGRALVERLLSRGHYVWGLARSDQTDFAHGLNGQFRSSRCDVSLWAEVESAAREVQTDWAQLDGIITCAGIQGEVGRALAANPADWSATVRANLEGTYHALRAFAPLLEKATRRAKIVCFSGGGATQARPNFSAYGVAKTGIVRLVETIAAEEKNKLLDINAIAPGSINTRLTDEIITLGPAIAGTEEYQAALQLKKTDGTSLGQALNLVEWLLSPASDGISGKLLSAQWDPWASLDRQVAMLTKTDVYTLRRILPEDRAK